MGLEPGESSSRKPEIEISVKEANGADLSSTSNDLEAGITRVCRTKEIKLDMMLKATGLTLGRDDKKSISSPCLEKRLSNITSRLNKKDKYNEIKVVAIGPYHRNSENLYFSKMYKLRILRWMIQVFALDKEMFLKEINSQIHSIQRTYSVLDSISSEEFAEMLLLDSCFIFFTLKRFGCDAIEMLHSAVRKVLVQEDSGKLWDEANYLATDIIHHYDDIKLDLIMFENQIPFIVIKELLKTYPALVNFIDERSIQDLALLFFTDIYPNQNEELIPENSPEFLHLLHLFHWSRVPADKKYTIIKRDKRQTPFIPSATELQQSGITFKMKRPGSSLDITFEQDYFKVFGTFKIPVVHINECNQILFRNLLAFERENTEIVGGYFIAYVAWFAHLLQSEDDVKLLKKNRIVPNTPTLDIEAVYFFQGLKRETEITKEIPQLYDMYKIVRDHHEGSVNRCYGAFKLQYCSNFWVTIGVILFCVVTLLQTIYTALSYYATLKGLKH